MSKAHARPDLDGAKFHLHMCALAEELEYAALYAFAHRKLTDLLIANIIVPEKFVSLVDAAFRTTLRDEEGWIKRLVVVAALIQQTKHYTYKQQDAFRDMVKRDEYPAFWKMYSEVREENSHLLGLMGMAKEKRRERTRLSAKERPAGATTMAGRVGKSRSERKEEARRTAAVIKGLESMGLE